MRTSANHEPVAARPLRSPPGSRARDVTIATERAGQAKSVGAAWLEDATGQRYDLPPETSIGREARNSLCLEDPSVSRSHALIQLVEDGYQLADLGSANGTFVNNRPIRKGTPYLLKAGDRVRFAGLERVFRQDQSGPLLETFSTGDSGGGVSQIFSLSGVSGIQPEIQGDLRIVTVLFADLQGFTTFSETLPPDQVTAIMNACFRALTEAVTHFGGYVDKYVGDAMMVLFGAPVAHEDDPERAVRAALAMQDKLTELNQQFRQKAPRANIKLQMRIGINTGEVLAGRVGAGQFSTFTVMGDSVNLASRLEHEARVGHILVGETTYRLTRQVIRYDTLPPLMVKGKQEPVQTYEVTGVEGDLAALKADTGFVGRPDALGVLAQVLQRPEIGLHSVMVAGEAGVGKSALLAELYRRHNRDARWVLVRCFDYDRQSPYSALKRLTRDLMRGADAPSADATQAGFESGSQHVLALARLLGHDPGSMGDPKMFRNKLAGAFPELVRQTSVDQPVVLAIDGAQYADEETLAILAETAARLRGEAVTLLVTARPGWEQPWPVTLPAIELSRLSRDECAEHVTLLLGAGAVDPATLDTLTEQSEGSPLLLEEIVRGHMEGGTLRLQDGIWRLAGVAYLGKAPGLRSIVQARLDQLSAEERRVLQIASLIGRSWDSGLIAAVDRALHVEQTLQHLVAMEYLSVRGEADEAPRYAFRREITREVAYATLPEMERQNLHRAVAVAMELQYDPARPDASYYQQVAQHYAAGRAHDRAAVFMLRSADAAAGLFANRAAIAQYTATLAYAARISGEAVRHKLIAETRERLGEVLLRESLLDEAHAAFKSSMDVGGPEARARLTNRLAMVEVRRGRYQLALKITESNLLPGVSVDPVSRAHSESLQAYCLVNLGDARRAVEFAQEAAQQRPGGQPPRLALYALGAARVLLGDLAGAQEALEHNIAAARVAIDLTGQEESYALLAIVQCLRGDPQRAADALRRAAQIASRTPERWESADLEALERAFEETLREESESQSPWNLARRLSVLGRLMVERGYWQRAVPFLRGGRELAERVGAQELALEIRMEEARAALASEWPESAIEPLRAIVTETDTLALQPMSCQARLLLCEALLAQGAAAEALELARGTLVQTRWQGMRWLEAVGHRVVGQALARGGDQEQASGHLTRAAAGFERMQAHPDLARTLIIHAQADQQPASAPPTEESRVRLTRALELAQSAGLESETRLAQRLLDSLEQ